MPKRGSETERPRAPKRRSETEVQNRQSGSGRGGLHVESAIDSYGEVINRFGLRLAAEPLYLLTSWLNTFVDPPAELGTLIWALSGEQARPGFVFWTLRGIS